MTIAERAAAYNNSTHGQKYPDSRLSCHTGRFASGTWCMGNNYRGSGYYGSYPPAYVPRMMALFPDAHRVLHVFSGSLAPGAYVRCDVRRDQRPDACCDVQHLPFAGVFDLILADPPYSAEDLKRYGTKMPNRKKALAECGRALRPGGHVIWLDTAWPMFRKIELNVVGFINIIRSTNHRYRTAAIFTTADRGEA